MAVQHKDITGADLHELKGVSTAPQGSFAKASSGTTVWAFDEDFIDVDIASLNSATSYYVLLPHTGTIVRTYAVIDGAIGTSNTVITFKIGGVTVTAGTLTIPFASSAAGTLVSATPTANNSAVSGTPIEIAVSGASTGTARCHVVIVFLRTA